MALRILIVDRNQKIGSLVCGQLREKGYEARDVRHGAEAAVALRDAGADIILLDHQIPMGGVRTARVLRLHPRYRTIPMVLTLPATREDARQIIADGQRVGLSHFLLKPFTLAALQKKLDDVAQAARGAAQPTFMEVREEIRSLTNLPSMPEAHSKLLALLSKPDNEVDLDQVARALQLDAALAARVMRVCRSAFFGFQGNVMKHAVAFLGVAEVRKIVQSAVIYRVFDDTKGQAEQRFSMADLWRHSLAVGCAMEIIGGTDKKRTHFLLGVLHDIGKAIFRFRFPEHFSAVLDLVEKESISVYQAEGELLGITHAECGSELAVNWALPGDVRTAIGSHHSPSQTTQHRRLAALVHISDIAVRTMGIGYAGDPLIPPFDPYAQRMQGEREVNQILSRQEEIQRQVDAMVGGEDAGPH
jgi:HD-like signal output (HDOD) protein/CheY-like chemotaxis protein